MHRDRHPECLIKQKSENIKSNDLTTSAVERPNILNNPYAVTEIQKSVGLRGIEYHGKAVLLKEQVAEFFEVTPRTIGNYLSANELELGANGYEVLRGKALQELKLAIKALDVDETDFVNITKVPQLGVFSFRAFLNLTMLITESERARLPRPTTPTTPRRCVTI